MDAGLSLWMYMHVAIVWHNTNFATVYSQVTRGGSSMEFEHKLLCQFSLAVARRMPYISVFICLTSL